MKKYIAILLLVLISSSLSLGQEVTMMDSLSMVNLDADAFEYINISVDDEFVIEGKEDLLIDMSLLDVPNGVDSLKCTITSMDDKKEYVFNSLNPLLLKNIESSSSISLSVFSNGEKVIFKSSKGDALKLKIEHRDRPTFVSDTIVFGILAIILALIFYTNSLNSKGWKKFYMFVPALLLCYLVPAILDSLGLIS